MKTLLFPGQGSQSVGMGSDLYKNFDLVKKIFHEADQKLKYSLSKIILEGPESELKLTKNTQPAILIISYSIIKLITEEFNIQVKKNSKYLAGHSLGEYSALVASGSLSFGDALVLLHERGKAMQEAVPEGKGLMLAVMGLKIDELNSYISEIKKELAESEKLKIEAKNLLSDYESKIDKSKKETQEIINVAKKDSERNILEKSKKFHQIMEDRKKNVEQKIIQMKENALKDIKNASVKITMETVEHLIKNSIDKNKLEKLHIESLEETKSSLKQTKI